MDASTPGGSTYIPEFDGLRGAAVLLVLFYHAQAKFLRGGFLGVDLFFVLSGYLITSLLAREFQKNQDIQLRKFYARRALRLGPALVLLLLVFCSVSYLALGKGEFQRNGVDALIVLFYGANWARAFGLHAPVFLGHAWSLSIEEQFYFLWPMVLLVALRLARKRWQVALFTLSLALASWLWRVALLLGHARPERLYNGLDTRADALMTGCFLGILLSSGFLKEATRNSLAKGTRVLAPPAGVGILLLCRFLTLDEPRVYGLWLAIVEVLAGLIVACLALNQRGLMRRLFATKGLVWFGQLSYGIYLWHYPVFATLFTLGCHGKTVLTLGTALTTLFASASYYLMERPLLKAKQRFAV